MKTTTGPCLLGTYPNGSPRVSPSYEIEILCSSCRDLMSREDKEKNTCVLCGKPWQETRNATVHVATFPPLFGVVSKV